MTWIRCKGLKRINIWHLGILLFATKQPPKLKHLHVWLILCLSPTTGHSTICRFGANVLKNYLLWFIVLTTVALLVFIMMQSCLKPSALLRIGFFPEKASIKYCKLCLFKDDLRDEQCSNQSSKPEANRRLCNGFDYKAYMTCPNTFACAQIYYQRLCWAQWSRKFWSESKA